MERGVEVNNVPTAVLDDEEAVQQPKRRGRHGEQIHRSNVVLVVAQERYPSLHLVGLGWAPRHIPRHSDLGDDEPELRELRVDSRRTPTVLGHRPDKPTNLGVNSRPARISPAGNASPVPPEPLTIPTGNGVSVDDDQTTGPRRPGGPERDPECSTDVVKQRARALFLQRSHLLSQSQVFDHKVGSAPAHRPDRARAERDEEDENTKHGGGVCLFRSLISSGSSPL